MDNNITKAKIVSSLLWKFTERIGVQGIQFVVMILLARLLLPEDFGLIVLVTIFVSIAGVIAQSGFNTALIQKKNVDEVDLSSVFYLNFFIATILYIVLFITAPSIASFFDQPQLTLVLRLLSLTLFFSSFQSIQHTIIARNMQFKKLFFSSIGGVVLSGFFGIVMAYAGYGIWSLLAQQLINQIVYTATLFYTVKWRPQLLFSIVRLRNLFSYGWKILASALIDSIYTNISSLIIGKLFSPATLGFYNRGEQIPNILIGNINGSIQSVLFPALSAEQDNKKRIKEMVRRAIVTSSFIIFPVMVGLAVVAESLVEVLLTEKWLPAVPFIQIFCAAYAFWPIHTSNLQAINALGKSEIFLKLEILKTLLGFLLLIISLPFGVYAIAIALLISSILCTFINSYPNFALLNYGCREQWKDISPALIISLIMGTIVYPLQWVEISAILTLIIQICVGIVVYISLAKLFKFESYAYILGIFKNSLSKKKLIKKEEKFI